jgi:hypothetical protein
MSQDQIQPEVWLHLLYHMCELQSGNAVDRIFIVSERLEKRNDAFGNSTLFPSFMDVYRLRVVEQNLSVGIFFFLGFFRFWLQGWIDTKTRADLKFREDILHF